MIAGAAITPSPITGLHTSMGVEITGGGVPPNSGLIASELNSFRISAVIDRLSVHLCSHNKKDPVEFLNLFLSLSRGIDYAILNHEVPPRCRELPSIIKQVCQYKNDNHLLAALMVLMISVKSACQIGWFSYEDSEQLNNLAKEIASNFYSVPDFNTDPSRSLSVISTIMSRFYPRMKVGHIFVFLEVKPGYDTYVSDFQISKNLKFSPGDKIRLFVVQTDSTETSSCLVTPAKVNFLLNGKEVDRRNNLFLDTGPQPPTDVTPSLKYGPNLFQAVGEFNGNYVIAVAVVSELPNSDSTTLQDYEQHPPATVDADSEVIEGSSRISLNCPISFRRIKTPVKGHSCKHIQCFDFDNYVDINSRRPSWRCPSCNQHVCFSDIRIDQNMAKVLKEVDPNVSNIIVSSDGSWNAVMERENSIEKPDDKTSNTGQDESPQPTNVLDLTKTDEMMNAVPTYQTEDRKHSTAHGPLSVTQTTEITPQIANTNNVHQSSGQVDSDFWSTMYMSLYGLGSSNVQLSEQTSGVSIPSSVLTESTSLNREVEALHHSTVVTTSAPRNVTSLPNMMQSQQYQFGSPFITNEYGRFSSIPRHITRTATAAQTIHAQTTASVLQRSSTNDLNSFIPNGLSAASRAPPAAPNLTMSRANPRQFSPISSSPLIKHSSIQNFKQQKSQFPSARPPHQDAGFPDSNQVPSMYRVSIEHCSSTQQMTNFRVPRPTTPSPGMIRSPMQSTGSFLRPQTVHRTGVASGPQSHLGAAANRAVQMSVDTSRTIPLYPPNPNGRTIPTSLGDQRDTGVAASQTVDYDPADLSWRPPGRMRGALSGQAYKDYYNQFISIPNQQAQAARSISSMTPPANVRPQLQGGVVHCNLAPDYPNSAPVGRPMGSNIFPSSSSGMQ